MFNFGRNSEKSARQEQNELNEYYEAQMVGIAEAMQEEYERRVADDERQLQQQLDDFRRQHPDVDPFGY